jgi:hypothetical protein
MLHSEEVEITLFRALIILESKRGKGNETAALAALGGA